MDAVDAYIPNPARPVDKPFIMPVEDVFTITGRGTVVTGRIEAGIVKVGEEVEIIGLRDTVKKVVTGVEMFKKSLDQGQAGDNAGILLRGVERKDVERGMVLAKPGSITPHTKFTAAVYVLGKDEGGRHTPFFNKYRPQFYFRTTDVTGSIELEAGREMVMPGDNVTLTVELISPSPWKRASSSPSVKAAALSAPAGLTKSSSKGSRHGRHRPASLHRVQAQELHYHQEQAHHHGQARIQEALPLLWGPQAPPRRQVIESPVPALRGGDQGDLHAP